MTKKRRRRIESGARRRDPEYLASDGLVEPRINGAIRIEAPDTSHAPRETRAACRDGFRNELHEEWEARVQQDYAYVKRDLKRIVSISTFLFTIMLLAWLHVEVVGAGL